MMKTQLLDYIGIPYEDLHCWDLARLFYQNEFHLDLQHIYDGPNPLEKSETEQLVKTNVGAFMRVLKPEFGDLVLISILGFESHIAIYIGNGKILHTSERIGSHVDRLEKFSKVVVGFYRHKEVAK